jgi:hypothetical protein
MLELISNKWTIIEAKEMTLLYNGTEIHPGSGIRCDIDVSAALDSQNLS